MWPHTHHHIHFCCPSYPSIHMHATLSLSQVWPKPWKLNKIQIIIMRWPTRLLLLFNLKAISFDICTKLFRRKSSRSPQTIRVRSPRLFFFLIWNQRQWPRFFYLKFISARTIAYSIFSYLFFVLSFSIKLVILSYIFLISLICKQFNFYALSINQKSK